MEYKGSFDIYDYEKIKTYPISERSNKVNMGSLHFPERLSVNEKLLENPSLIELASAIKKAKAEELPIIWFYGAHIIKNGLGPLLIGLMKKGFVSHFATNGAGAIHDFELALIGETSENVPNALNKGLFGMAEETGKIMNEAFTYGNAEKIGAGEALSRIIMGDALCGEYKFSQPKVCVLAQSHAADIPHTLHITLGADIIHQHPKFDPEAIGGTSGRDFAIFAETVKKMHKGGVLINLSSAVTGPEVFLKSISMAANCGFPPDKIVTADFDIRPAVKENSTNEEAASYYFRDYKSIVTRIPDSFNGKGFYIEGNHKETFPALYKLLRNNE